MLFAFSISGVPGVSRIRVRIMLDFL
jgi:hypothetical protein